MAPLPPGTLRASPRVIRRRGRPSVRRLAIGFLATAALAGCAGDSPGGGRTGDAAAATGPRPWATSELRWEVTLEAVSEPDLFLTSISDVDVDSRGRVFLVDRALDGITVVTPELSLLRTVGREGEGPGEFRFMEVQILPGDTLLVYDFGLGRITLFDPENLELVTTMPPPNLGGGGGGGSGALSPICGSCRGRGASSRWTGFPTSPGPERPPTRDGRRSSWRSTNPPR